ncbi:MAG: endonuclease/exonuclease/phosphatase family protein [Myxococcota bacterium]
MPRGHVAVIDPGTRVPELDCFNRMALASPLPLTYHLVAQQGFDTLARGEADLRGIVVLGSGASVHDPTPWVRTLAGWLEPRVRAGVPVLGLCFGHQLLARVLGGEVGWLHPDRRKLRGLRRVTLDADRLWGEARAGDPPVTHAEAVRGAPGRLRRVATARRRGGGVRAPAAPGVGLPGSPRGDPGVRPQQRRPGRRRRAGGLGLRPLGRRVPRAGRAVIAQLGVCLLMLLGCGQHRPDVPSGVDLVGALQRLPAAAGRRGARRRDGRRALAFDGPAAVVLLGIGAVAIAIQLWNIFPYSPFVRVEVPHSPPREGDDLVSLLAVNVEMVNTRGDVVVRQIREQDADIVFLVETDRAWLDRVADAVAGYPFRESEPRDNYYGLLFCTRLEVLDFAIRHLTDDEHPSVRAHLRSPGGREFVFYGLHPDPPTPFDGTEIRDSDLVLVAREVAACDLPVVAAGDLNDVGWSHTTRLFRRLSGMLDPRIGRGLYATFHARYPLLRWPLDHLFHTADFTLRALQVLGPNGSDHFPVYAELCLAAPERALAEPPPDPDTADEEQAEELVERGMARVAEDAAPPAVSGARIVD